jgi:hypothetical protein
MTQPVSATRSGTSPVITSRTVMGTPQNADISNIVRSALAVEA